MDEKCTTVSEQLNIDEEELLDLIQFLHFLSLPSCQQLTADSKQQQVLVQCSVAFAFLVLSCVDGGRPLTERPTYRTTTTQFTRHHFNDYTARTHPTMPV